MTRQLLRSTRRAPDALTVSALHACRGMTLFGCEPSGSLRCHFQLSFSQARLRSCVSRWPQVLQRSGFDLCCMALSTTPSHMLLPSPSSPPPLTSSSENHVTPPHARIKHVRMLSRTVCKVGIPCLQFSPVSYPVSSLALCAQQTSNLLYRTANLFRKS